MVAQFIVLPFAFTGFFWQDESGNVILRCTHVNNKVLEGASYCFPKCMLFQNTVGTLLLIWNERLFFIFYYLKVLLYMLQVIPELQLIREITS